MRSRGADFSSVRFSSVRDLRNVLEVNVSVKWIHW